MPTPAHDDHAAGRAARPDPDAARAALVRLAPAGGRPPLEAAGATLTTYLRQLRTRADVAGEDGDGLVAAALELHDLTARTLLDLEGRGLSPFYVRPRGLVRLARALGWRYAELVALMLRDAARRAPVDSDRAGHPLGVDATGVRRAWNAEEGRPADPVWPAWGSPRKPPPVGLRRWGAAFAAWCRQTMSGALPDALGRRGPDGRDGTA